MDAAQTQVVTQAATGTTDGGSGDVRIVLDKSAYRSGDTVTVDGGLPGAQGDALVTLESALGVQTTVVPANGGRAIARFRAVDAAGQLRVGAAFVRNGAIAWNGVALGLVAPGRPQNVPIALARTDFAPNEAANIALRDQTNAAGTVVVRISRGTPSGSAVFDSAPSLLEVGVATTQSSAPAAVTWHPWVDSTGQHAQVLGFVRRTQPPSVVELAQAETQAVSWSVARATNGSVDVQMPAQSGRYTLSVLAISDDGSVSAGSSSVIVK